MAKKKKATVNPDELNPFADNMDVGFEDEVDEVVDITPAQGETSEDEVRLLRELEASSLELQEEARQKKQVMSEFNEAIAKLTTKRDALLDALKAMREEAELGIQRLPGM